MPADSPFKIGDLARDTHWAVKADKIMRLRRLLQVVPLMLL